MSCGCKGNNPVQEKIVPKGIEPIVVQALSKPEPVDYTIQDVIRIKDYLSAMNKKDSEKQFITEILYKNFGDIIPSYCDQNCLKGIAVRAQQMEARLSN
jgi:hypothetical protein